MTTTGRAPVPGRLLGSGRTADVYEIDGAWVLRRDREGWCDAAAEAAVMEHVRRHGYPAPAVRTVASRTDLVMERLEGPTMLQAFVAGTLDFATGGTLLARLLRALHAVPGRSPSRPGLRVLHLDLHPENVILTADGPRVIDWGTAEDGDPGLDWGMSAVILAQAAVSAERYAEAARATLTALLAAPSGLSGPDSGLDSGPDSGLDSGPDSGPDSGLDEEGLGEALRRRAANPTMSEQEVGLLGAAGELIRALTAATGGPGGLSGH
ncbi:phosphotransferase [Streptomyces sp. SS7]|uniref:phosphotransferase n=1 Tax=Streptomyces sp. SS7 TaxID=3108485 RepID=UPI0030EDFFC8